MNKGKLFIISAPSGAGKTTLVKEVIERLQETYALERVVTYTTKKPRSNEVNGVDYHFITQEDFIKKIEDGFFVEHSTAYCAYYGFPRSLLDEVEQGAYYLAILDRNGAEAIKAHKDDVVLIWIKPPTKESLHERLTGRAQENEQEMMYRLALADKELALEDQTPFYHHVIVNDDLRTAAEQLELIIRQAL